jgi:competence protein ComEC
VAPLLVTVLDGLPVASLPANVLAAPAAALVMTWGLPAGLLAGALGDPWASALHAPTAAALAWLHGVARAAASVPLGEMGAPHLAVLVVVLVVAVAVSADGRRARVVRPACGVAVLAVLAAPALALSRPPAVVEPEPGVRVWRAEGGAVVVVRPGTGPTATLRALRRAGVTRADVLVVGPGATAADEERAARHRVRVGRTVWVDADGTAPPVRAGRLVVDPGSGSVRLVGPAP